MAVTSSGEIKLSDLAAEFEDAAPHEMSEFYREGGLVPGNNTNVPTTGQVGLGNFYGSVNELLQSVTAGAASVSASSLFGSDWGSAVPKRISVTSGITIGKLTIESGMGGTLEVDVYGEIQGTGGSANGGSGGNAIDSNHSFTLNVQSGGAVRGGGGGGGLGGTGGGGQYSTTSNQYRNGSRPYNGFERKSGAYHNASWARPAFYSYPYYVGGVGLNSYSLTGNDGAYYTAGGQYFNDNEGHSGRNINRQSTSTTNTNGGSGGNGGVGAGYGQSSSGGSAGSAGGTNAGTGGTGGSGGGFGSAGSTGATGANGNRTNGSAGSGGGAAGKAVNMISGTLTLNNSGTVNGAT
jgi:hypothetical protein